MNDDRPKPCVHCGQFTQPWGWLGQWRHFDGTPICTYRQT